MTSDRENSASANSAIRCLSIDGTSVASIVNAETRTGLAGDSPSCDGDDDLSEIRHASAARRSHTPGTPGLFVPIVNKPPGTVTSCGPGRETLAAACAVEVAPAFDAGAATSPITASRLSLSDPHPLLRAAIVKQRHACGAIARTSRNRCSHRLRTSLRRRAPPRAAAPHRPRGGVWTRERDASRPQLGLVRISRISSTLGTLSFLS